MSAPIAVDSLTVDVITDNMSDTYASKPVFATSEMANILKAVAEVGDEQGLARDFLGPGLQDVGHLRGREHRFARVGIAHVVGNDIDGE